MGGVTTLGSRLTVIVQSEGTVRSTATTFPLDTWRPRSWVDRSSKAGIVLMTVLRITYFLLTRTASPGLARLTWMFISLSSPALRSL